MNQVIAIACRRMSCRSLTDILIALVTRSRWVHTELVIPSFAIGASDAETLVRTGVTYTSVPDRGVIRRTLPEGRWTCIEFQCSSVTVERVRAWCESQVGEKYDPVAALSYLFKKLPQDPNKRTCVEVVVGALNNAGRYSISDAGGKSIELPKISTRATPGELLDTLKSVTRVFKVADGRLI